MVKVVNDPLLVSDQGGIYLKMLVEKDLSCLKFYLTDCCQFLSQPHVKNKLCGLHKQNYL